MWDYCKEFNEIATKKNQKNEIKQTLDQFDNKSTLIWEERLKIKSSYHENKTINSANLCTPAPTDNQQLG